MPAPRPSVAIGDLRHRVALQNRTMTPNGTDDYTNAYATIASVWAAVEAVGGTRLIGTAQDQGGTTHTVTIRWRSDRTAWRYVLLADGRRLHVETMRDPDETRRMLVLDCAEETGT